MIYKNLQDAVLIEESIKRNESKLSKQGCLVAKTGKFTGRAANDKYIVLDENTEHLVDWGKVNTAISKENYNKLKQKVLSVLSSKDSFFQNRSVGADHNYTLPLEVHTEFAWHSLFSRHMFLDQFDESKTQLAPFRIYHAPSAKATPKEDGTKSETFIILNFSEREIIIGGTFYAGEIKKSVFTTMNYLLPQLNILTMHCGANIGTDGNTALFFGLSGTGKTTLSTDTERPLIGDDEHGWSLDGIFNIEGGCYAKAIRLSKTAEPEIYECTQKFGTILENVVMSEDSHSLDLDSSEITENTRAAYPLRYLSNVNMEGKGSHPTAVIMLTCDAFGVLPPIAKLTPEQAMYYFLSGYTAKVAGTEAGLGKEPVSTFSACFGEPFMALSPTVYARLLGERLRQTSASCYLVNTGWWKGGYGQGGERMPISMSRTLVRAAVSGSLLDGSFVQDSVFGFLVPQNVEGIPSTYLNMENTWANRDEYKKQAQKVARMFQQNFHRYDGKVEDDIYKSGPLL